MKKTDETPFGIPGVVELIGSSDGSCRVQTHGPHCRRTQQVAEAVESGSEIPHPDSPHAARCGPAKITSDAYRAGWDAINWSGKKTTVGQA